MLVLVGNDDARVLVQATEAGSIALTGASTVVAAVKAAASLVISLAGSSTGVAPIAGQSASTIGLVGSGSGAVPVAASAQLTLPIVGAGDASASDGGVVVPATNRAGGGGRARYAGQGRYFNPRAAASPRPFQAPRDIPISVGGSAVIELRVASTVAAHVGVGSASQLTLSVSAGVDADDAFFRAAALFLLDEAA
jgi:hypothetical protein